MFTYVLGYACRQEALMCLCCVCVSAQAQSGRLVCVCVCFVGSKASQGRQGLRESTAADLSVRKELLKVWLGVCMCVCLRRALIVPPKGREGGLSQACLSA